MICGMNQLVRSKSSVVPASLPFSAMPLPPASDSDCLIVLGEAVTRTSSRGERVSTTEYCARVRVLAVLPSNTRNSPPSIVSAMPADSLSMTLAEISGTKMF